MNTSMFKKFTKFALPIIFALALVLTACGGGQSVKWQAPAVLVTPTLSAPQQLLLVQTCQNGGAGQSFAPGGAWYECPAASGSTTTGGPSAPNAPATAAATSTTTAPAATTATIATGPGYGPCDVGGLQTFSPIDDESHGRFATDVVMPDGLSLNSAWRSWQAVNPDRRGSKNTVWINLIADLQATDPTSVTVTLKEPIRYEVRGKGMFILVLTRDLHAVEQLKERSQFNGVDPYDVAVTGDYSQQSKTLSVYWQGSGRIMNQACAWYDLNRTSFSQAPFAKDFRDGYVFYLDLGKGGAVDLWIGATEYTSGTNLHSAFDLPTIVAK